MFCIWYYLIQISKGTLFLYTSLLVYIIAIVLHWIYVIKNRSCHNIIIAETIRALRLVIHTSYHILQITHHKRCIRLLKIVWLNCGILWLNVLNLWLLLSLAVLFVSLQLWILFCNAIVIIFTIVSKGRDSLEILRNNLWLS